MAKKLKHTELTEKVLKNYPKMSPSVHEALLNLEAVAKTKGKKISFFNSKREIQGLPSNGTCTLVVYAKKAKQPKSYLSESVETLQSFYLEEASIVTAIKNLTSRLS